MEKHALVSYPRSGRGLLRTLLTLYHGEGYVSQRVGFPGADGADLLLTHDFETQEDYPDRQVVVMVRHPLASLASWFTQNVNGGSRVNTLEDFKVAVGSGMIDHWKRFVAKWIIEKDSFVLLYDDLADAPSDSLVSVLRFLGTPVTNTRVEGALDKCKVARRNDHSGFPYYVDLGFVHDLECRLDPELGMLQDMGVMRVERGIIK